MEVTRSLDCGMLGQIRVQYLLPLSLGFEEEFNGVAEGAFAAGVWGSVMGLSFHVGAGVLGSDSESGDAHGW